MQLHHLQEINGDCAKNAITKRARKPDTRIIAISCDFQHKM